MLRFSIASSSWFMVQRLWCGPSSYLCQKGYYNEIFLQDLQHQIPFPLCRRLWPGEKCLLTTPSPTAGSPCPKSACSWQREQEVRQQAQQEGTEGQPDTGHPAGHVLRGLAPLLCHQCDTGKQVPGFSFGRKSFFFFFFSVEVAANPHCLPPGSVWLCPGWLLWRAHLAGILQQHHEPHHLPTLHEGLQESHGQIPALLPAHWGAPAQCHLPLHEELQQRAPCSHIPQECPHLASWDWLRCVWGGGKRTQTAASCWRCPASPQCSLSRPFWDGNLRAGAAAPAARHTCGLSASLGMSPSTSAQGRCSARTAQQVAPNSHQGERNSGKHIPWLMDKAWGCSSPQHIMFPGGLISSPYLGCIYQLPVKAVTCSTLKPSYLIMSSLRYGGLNLMQNVQLCFLDIPHGRGCSACLWLHGYPDSSKEQNKLPFSFHPTASYFWHTAITLCSDNPSVWRWCC